MHARFLARAFPPLMPPSREHACQMFRSSWYQAWFHAVDKTGSFFYNRCVASEALPTTSRITRPSAAIALATFAKIASATLAFTMQGFHTVDWITVVLGSREVSESTSGSVPSPARWLRIRYRVGEIA